MTFKMVRCRSVSAESTECSRPSAAAGPVFGEVSLLSPMALNVAAPPTRIKHVFDWRVAGRPGPEKRRHRPNHKCVTLAETGYLCLVTVVEADGVVGGVI
ncbi:hypothetical protein MINTM008_37820 [Mycobacterium intracellulare]|uniref:Uncharacterized protein n=1 Tax=Mycobacterium intracellulare TaxID=1767 RepID=A0A7R7MVV2_MYCIT|nr:hypothetical protein MINTM002_35110 [Mycobacterium intracellulare]BCP16522.1 hypothetical protein MINTM021_34310 [Mycobacterium paraintracellulare]BCP38175.1 hypothetical protein MINTMi198_35450 [Mycobacterium intracellulare M.i.198]BCO58361.1 hypothetical protein MINTM005_36050 [Mycobacterium intracellulare]BCO63617.1 hypothetical protein MINTM006_35670 [Mycobacterium intracellulare]